VDGFYLKSNLFNIVDGEDEQTNPHRYGKELSNWLSEKLKDLGYETEVIPEDWGWCVMCKRKPFMLWVGCGNIDEVEKEDIIWHCFVEAEISIFKKIFRKINTKGAIDKLSNELKEIFESEKKIKIAEINQ